MNEYFELCSAGWNRLREACNSIISENQFTVFLIYGRVPKIHLIHPNPRWAERWAIKPTTGNHILGTTFVNFFSPLHLHNFNQPNSINIQYESLARNGWKGKCQSISPEGQLEVEVKLLASSLSPRTFSQGKLHRNSPTKTNNFSPQQHTKWSLELTVSLVFLWCSRNPRPMKTEEIFSDYCWLYLAGKNVRKMLVEREKGETASPCSRPAHNLPWNSREGKRLLGNLLVFVCAKWNTVSTLVKLQWESKHLTSINILSGELKRRRHIAMKI